MYAAATFVVFTPERRRSVFGGASAQPAATSSEAATGDGVEEESVIAEVRSGPVRGGMQLQRARTGPGCTRRDRCRPHCSTPSRGVVDADPGREYGEREDPLRVSPLRARPAVYLDPRVGAGRDIEGRARRGRVVDAVRPGVVAADLLLTPRSFPPARTTRDRIRRCRPTCGTRGRGACWASTPHALRREASRARRRRAARRRRPAPNWGGRFGRSAARYAPASSFIFRARARSSSVTPPASWVTSSTSTRFHTFRHSGW